MNTPEPAFTLGIEEEYLLVDPASRDVVADPPEGLWRDCETRLAGQVGPEFMRCQIEVGTPVCRTVAEAAHEVARLRRTVAEVTAAHGLAFIAASTHPFGSWQPQKPTERARYQQLAEEIGRPVKRLLICAIHVHVGIEDPNLRIDLMNQARYFLPHLLCLATSSPFWQGQDTRLNSYRLAVFNELPRTGMPEAYRSYGEYEQQLNALVATGVIQDGTKLWWDIRPSASFPTVEMRICDVCTRMADGVTVAALFLALMRMLWRLRRNNTAWREYRTLLINENRWRAMRYGFDEGLIDFGRGELVPYRTLLEEVLALVAEDAEALGCTAELANARAILDRGTSAHNQRRVFAEAKAAGASDREALERVVDWLRAETLIGLDPSAPAPAGLHQPV